MRSREKFLELVRSGELGVRVVSLGLTVTRERFWRNLEVKKVLEGILEWSPVELKRG